MPAPSVHEIVWFKLGSELQKKICYEHIDKKVISILKNETF